MTSHRCASCLLLLLLSPGVFALTDRAELQRWCQGGSVAAAGRCFGYLRAVEDILARGPVDGIRACVPAASSLGEQHQALGAWLSAHPQESDTPALTLVARAWAAHFPCTNAAP